VRVVPLWDGFLDRCRSLEEVASILGCSRLYAANAVSNSLIDVGIHRAADQAVEVAAAAVALEELVVKAQVGRCSFLECDSLQRQGCSVGVAAKLGDSLDAEGIVDARVVPRDWALVYIVRGYWAVQVVLAGYHSQGIDPVVNNSLANTEIEAGTGPFYTLHAVACAVGVALYNLAWEAVHFVDLDSSSLP
jgi:hypothetical protein